MLPATAQKSKIRPPRCNSTVTYSNGGEGSVLFTASLAWTVRCSAWERRLYPSGRLAALEQFEPFDSRRVEQDDRTPRVQPENAGLIVIELAANARNL
jgi:hypothetical protein